MFGSLFKNKTENVQINIFISALHLPAAVLQEDGKILCYNEALLNLVGEKITEAKFLDNVIDSEPNKFSGELERIKNSALREISFEVKLAGAEGKTAKATIALLDSKLGGGFIVTMLDNHEQKTLEQKLNQSQKMQAVGQLAGGIAHDFNNLLTAMTGFCDLLLQRHPPGDKSFPDLMQVKQNVNRAANLVRQLLAFSRKQILKPKVLDITDVLSELSNLLRRLLGEKVRLDMRHGRDLWKIKADPGQIDQVTINLAVNARDAMPQGGVLTIETMNVKISNPGKDFENLFTPELDEKIQDGEYVLMRVVDTGTGIPHEVLPKIFEPFFSTKEVGAGTGLGLATVYGIIRQTGGYIYVKSELGRGTEFQIYLKKSDSQEVAVAESAADHHSKLGQDLTGKGKILLVEDEVPVRTFATRALTNKGYEIIEADNAETALEQLAKHGDKIDLIVTDVIMPGMNGPEMVKEIQKTNPNIKVIFMSGYTQDAFDSSEMSGAEINFLAKPFNLKDLALKVKEVMEKN